MSEKKIIRTNGDYVGRDKVSTASGGSVVIGGNVTGSTIITGSQNVVGDVANVFLPIYRTVDASKLPPQEKEDLKAEIAEVEQEVKKGDQANEGFLSRHLRNIRRMAPDILDVVLAALANPVAGLGMVAKKVAEKIKAEMQ